ncbi:hypothetical protein ABW20_dc0105193 [Dactylellina cionopaga]|nr:hypothetical protein ABW20_dc0105193 [Dactylellina cionopaga]
MPHKIDEVCPANPSKKLKLHSHIDTTYNNKSNISTPTTRCTETAGAQQLKLAFGIIRDNGDYENDYKEFELVNSTSLSSIQLPHVKDMHHCPDIFTKSVDASLEKPLSTCRKNISTLTSFLAFLDPSSLFTSPGISSIFERFLFGSAPHVNAFANTVFNFDIKNNNSVKDTQYLHIRGSPPSSPLSAYKSISILTSVCLFSADVVSSLSSRLVSLYTTYPDPQNYSSFKKELESLYNQPLTLNELDSLSRLSNTIADVVCTISRSHSPLEIKIILDIPQIQYYLSGPISRFQNNLSISHIWISIIDTRKAAIERIFTRCIEAEIWRRNSFINPIPNYKIFTTEGLSPILPLIRSSLLHSNKEYNLPVEACINTLRASVNTWDLFFEYLPLPTISLPQSIDELVFTSYVYELLLPFLSTLDTKSPPADVRQNYHHQEPQQQQQDTLILQIDNIVESKPYLKAKKFLEAYSKSASSHTKCNTTATSNKRNPRKIKAATLIGIYPSEQVFYSKEGGRWRSSLHKYDPGLRFRDDDVDHKGYGFVGLGKVLERVYGAEKVKVCLDVAIEESLLESQGIEMGMSLVGS